MKSTGVRRALVGASVCALTIVGFGAGTASAGEVTGNGKPVGSGTEVSFTDGGKTHYSIQIKGTSICAYSGLNDGFVDPKYADHPGDELNRVQSFGQIVKVAGPMGGAGMFCNPNNEPG